MSQRAEASQPNLRLCAIGITSNCPDEESAQAFVVLRTLASADELLHYLALFGLFIHTFSSGRSSGLSRFAVVRALRRRPNTAQEFRS